MKLTDYAAHDALGLAALVKRGEVTAEDLLACALEAAEALDGDLNAIVRSMEAEARAAIAGIGSSGGATGSSLSRKSRRSVQSSATPRLSKPGPRFAEVAGTSTATSRATMPPVP